MDGVQQARAGDMIHSIPELIEYASSLMTVFPGDVLQSGTSGGTGAGRVQRATGSGYLVDGETLEATIEGIGTLRHRVGDTGGKGNRSRFCHCPASTVGPLQ